MRNPWIKKNPLLSMWLSGANSIAGFARSRASADAKRQTAMAMTKGVKQIITFWSGALTTSPPRKRKKRR